MAQTTNNVLHTLYSRMLFSVIILALAVVLAAGGEASAQPITSDSRIKTFVFNPNEVFVITTHYGYQSNVEFAQKEIIETISVGDRVGWQIIPAGRRLFIRAMEENARTNMTVVTNRRAYQFELRSSASGAVFGSEALTYVVRFFYPGESSPDAISPPVRETTIPTPSIAAPVEPVSAKPQVQSSSAVATVASSPVAPAPKSVAPSTETLGSISPVARSGDENPKAVMPIPAPVKAPADKPLNYRYTFSGPDEVAPLRIYDDGKTTYFKLNQKKPSKIYIPTSAGTSIELPQRLTAEGLVAVDVVAQNFRIKQGSREVLVYNEADGGGK